MLQRVVWNLKLNVFSGNDGQFLVYCIALSNVNQPVPILVLRDERSVLIGERNRQVLDSGLNVGRRLSS